MTEIRAAVAKAFRSSPRVLNVGGGSKSIALPDAFDGWEHVLLDIDERLRPDIVCDAREMEFMGSDQFEAVYCSHNLEHYHPHEVPKVLAGFRHVLKNGGFVYLRVPDLWRTLQEAVRREGSLSDVVYQSAIGPITVADVIFGHAQMIKDSGCEFYSHRTGFSKDSLLDVLRDAGFWLPEVYADGPAHEIVAIGYKRKA